jgi:hypothetical protein
MFRLTNGPRRDPPNEEPSISPLVKQLDAVLRGSTENQNIGDRLMWTVADALLRDMRVAGAYRFAHWDRRFDAVPDQRKVHVLFDLGNVYYCDSWPQPVRDRIRRSIQFNRAFRQATVVYLPCGWGPYRREDRLLLRQLTHNSVVFARDRISLDYLNEALESELGILCPDLALMCAREEPNTGAELLVKLGVSTCEPLMGLIPNARCIENGVTPLKDPVDYRKHLQRVTEWARRNGYQLVGISHMVDTDRDRKLLDGLGIPMIESNDPSAIRSVIANLSVAVCSRYHGLVNCLVHGVPVVSLGWQHKYRGLMEYFELPQFDHPLAQSSGQLLDRLQTVALSRDRLSQQIRGKLEQARSDIRVRMGWLSRRLGGPSSVLMSPVGFNGSEIETVSSVRSNSGVRVLRFIKRLIAA